MVRLDANDKVWSSELQENSDTDWITLGDLTAFVEKNESGESHVFPHGFPD
jgi:hypothetical protein